MKKLMLTAVAIAILAVGFITFGRATAASPPTVTIRANGSVCEETGSISPQELTFVYGEDVVVAFKNAERLGIEIRNIPGGTFDVPGNSTVERTFKAAGNFVYAAWSAEGDCEKATARIKTTGGWWLRAWPWILAVVGSVAVVLIVRHIGRKYHQSPPSAPPKSQE
jgi:hypothetical protein